MATINGIPMATARLRGELCNATDYTQAEMVAWVLEDGVGSWLDRVRPVTVRLHLMQGYGSESHLFDRSAARVAAAVEGRLYESLAAIRKAVRGVPTRESLQYRVEIEAGLDRREVPAELEPAAEAIRGRAAAKHAAKRRRQRAKFVARLGVHRGGDGAYRVTTADAHRRGHWVDSISGRYWYCEGMDSRSGPDFVSVSGPNRGYATPAEAEAALAAVRAHYA
jgi:hypothetical protein